MDFNRRKIKLGDLLVETGTITQDTGSDENAVMSQKVVTEKLSELGSKYSITGTYKNNEVQIDALYWIEDKKDYTAWKNLPVNQTFTFGNLTGTSEVLILKKDGTLELKSANDSVVNLQKQVTDLQSKNNELIEENDVLQEKVTILSDTVNDKVQKEAELAQNYIPKGFPLRGTAAYDEQTKTTSDNAPIAIFQASSGTPVIGTASGKVVKIAGDSVNGYIVKVDHGNGYISIYRNGSQVKVKEGDDITAATVIFEIEEGHEELGYQIMKDDEYIDPFEIIEING